MSRKTVRYLYEYQVAGKTGWFTDIFSYTNMRDAVNAAREDAIRSALYWKKISKMRLVKIVATEEVIGPIKIKIKE